MRDYHALTLENWKKMRYELSQGYDGLPVSINYRKLYEDCLEAVERGEGFPIQAWDARGIYPQSHEAALRFFFWINCVNFNFNHSVWDEALGGQTLVKYARRNKDGRELRGAQAMASAFYDNFGEEPITTRHLKPHLKSKKRARALFAGINDIPMLEAREFLLSMACEVLDRDFGGDPANVFERGRFSAYGTDQLPGVFEFLLSNFSLVYGSDIHTWNGLQFHFHKRAHLLLTMYHGRAMNSGGALAPLNDIDEVPPMPDYELPRAYFVNGIFEYSEPFLRITRSANPVVRGHPYEIAMRAATVEAQTQELSFLNRLRVLRGLPSLNFCNVDPYRWFQGRANNTEWPLMTETTDH